MFYAIQVKYLGPTKTKRPRFKAWCPRGSVTIDASPDLEPWENMQNAAIALTEQLGWDYEFWGGTLPNGDMVWVMEDSRFGGEELEKLKTY